MRYAPVALLAGITCTAAPTFAGIVDSPIPAPFKQHVYSVSGVVNDGWATMFFCTNADKKAVTIGVEVFGEAGGAPANDAASNALLTLPGQSVLFVTNGVGGFLADSGLSPGTISKGSARILSTSKKIVCSAVLAKTDGTSMAPLSVVAKTKQKGD